MRGYFFIRVNSNKSIIMKRIIIVFVVLFLNSCLPKEKPHVVIKNKTKHTFDSIMVYTSIKLPTVFYSVEPNSIVKGVFLFDKDKYGDGNYKIAIYRNGSLYQNKGFGYYTNGGSLNRRFKIIIETDSIKVVSK